MMEATNETVAKQGTVKPEKPREAKSAWKQARPFVESLERLAGFKRLKEGEAAGEDEESNERNINRAALAQLRRTLGKKPDEAVPAFPYLAGWTDGLQNRWQIECYFLVASLFALHAVPAKQRSWHHGRGKGEAPRNFGASWRKLVDGKRDDDGEMPDEDEAKMTSLDRRLTTLLVSRRADLPARLRHAVQLLATNNIPVDWVQLLYDLMRWDAGDWKQQSWSKSDYKTMSPQRAWAQAFWRVGEVDEESNTDASDSVGANDTNLAASSIPEA